MRQNIFKCRKALVLTVWECFGQAIGDVETSGPASGDDEGIVVSQLGLLGLDSVRVGRRMCNESSGRSDKQFGSNHGVRDLLDEGDCISKCFLRGSDNLQR